MAPSEVLKKLLRKMNLLFARRCRLPCASIFNERVNGGKNQAEAFFGFRLSSARMVIDCAFGRLKARFGCLRREMDINLKKLSN